MSQAAHGIRRYLWTKRAHVIACILLMVISASVSKVRACPVPVFRYALERWPADAYRVLVFHRGGLSADQQALVDGLRRSASGEAVAPFYDVHVVDLDGELEPQVRKLWDAQDGAVLPWVVACYPRPADGNLVAWSGPLNADNIRSLVDSPTRRRIAERILKGDSAVWLLLESGDKAKDDPAVELLEKELKLAEEHIELSESAKEYVQQGTGQGASLPDLRIAFSIVRLTRDDPAERVLVSMLLGTESDLAGWSEPMIFPIYGRGRVLYALVGKGINRDNIAEACGFLVGDCSCEVKWQNPGMDLLMAVDWDAGIEGKWVIEAEPVPLAGLLGSGSQAASQPAGSDDAAPVLAGDESKNLLINGALGVFLGVVFVTAGAILFRRRRWSAGGGEESGA